MRTALKSRDNQTLMGIDDLTTWLLTRKHKPLPYTEADKGMASAEFKRLCEASPGDVEGEGVEMQLWVTLNKTRIREREKYVDHAIEEGTKGVKDIKKEEKKELLTFIGNRSE